MADRESEAEASPHLVHLFDTFALGEAQLRTTRIITALGERYRHTIITMDRRSDARRLIPGRLDVGVIGPPARRWTGLGRLLRLLRPNLVLLSSRERVGAFLATARHDVPLLLHVDGGRPETCVRPRLLATHLLRRVAGVATSSERNLSSLRRTFGRFKIPLILVPIGVDPSRAAPPATIAGFERRPGEVAVGMMLPPRHAADLQAILEAFRQAPHHRAAHLILFGSGPDRPSLAREAERLDLQDRVLFVDDAVDLAALAHEFDVFALAEGSGVGNHLVLEAMAAGLPLIGIAGPELQRLVTPGNREFLLPPDRRPALAAKMDALLRSTQLRRGLGRGNRDRARRFPLAPMAERYDELFRSLIDRAPAAARRRSD